MCTIGALQQGGKTLLLKNFDYASYIPLAWIEFKDPSSLSHLALVSHEQQGINSGLNEAGLGLVISEADPRFESTTKQELRTILNTEILTTCGTVEDAIGKIRRFAQRHPEMISGNVLLGDKNHIAVVEYWRREIRTRTVSKGFFASANHQLLTSNGIVHDRPDSKERYSRMELLLKKLSAQFPKLSRKEKIVRGKGILSRGPIFNDNTLSSCVIDVTGLKVYYRLGGAWKTLCFGRRPIARMPF